MRSFFYKNVKPTNCSLQKCCSRVGRPDQDDAAAAAACPPASDPDAKPLIDFGDPPGCCPAASTTDCWGELCTSDLPGML